MTLNSCRYNIIVNTVVRFTKITRLRKINFPLIIQKFLQVVNLYYNNILCIIIYSRTTNTFLIKINIKWYLFLK